MQPPPPPSFQIDAVREEVLALRPLADSRWLKDSWAAPEAFQQALIDYNATLYAPHAKSGATGFDFYHDAVLRFAGSERVALRTLQTLRDGERLVRTLSYADLHQRASLLATTLRELSLKPGDALCLLLPPGESLLVALFAGLRIGAVVSVLPPRGERYVAARIAALEPACIVTERLYARLVPKTAPAPHILTGAASGRDDEPLRRSLPDDRTHTYGPAAPVFAVCSPLREPSSAAVPVPAQQAYGRALRDALCLLSLKPGDGLCAPLPDFDPAQHYPGLLLSTLLAGATFVLADSEALGKDPSLLPRLGVTCLGLSRGLRDALRKLPAAACAPLARLHVWFRDVLEPVDVGAWRELDQRCSLAAVPRFNWVYEAAHGGALLCSGRYKGDANLLVWPAPGCAWKLSPVDAMGSSQAAPAQHGVFLPAGWKKPQAFVLLLKAKSSVGDGYLIGGTITPRRSAQIYPQAEVAAALSELPMILGVSGLALPDGSEPLRSTFILLLFLGQNAAGSGLRSAIERQITFAVGSEYQPDHIEVYPLFPRRLGPPEKPLSERPIDHAWCRSNYLIGALSQKTARPSQKLLGELRQACLQLPTAPHASGTTPRPALNSLEK